MSRSSVLLPAPFGATRPVRPGPTVNDRSWKTGVSSGQENDRCEQTTDASDMLETSTARAGDRGAIKASPRTPATRRCGHHPEMPTPPVTSLLASALLALKLPA